MSRNEMMGRDMGRFEFESELSVLLVVIAINTFMYLIHKLNFTIGWNV